VVVGRVVVGAGGGAPVGVTAVTVVGGAVVATIGAVVAEGCVVVVVVVAAAGASVGAGSVSPHDATTESATIRSALALMGRVCAKRAAAV
jgi:hypothetical protein